MNAFPPFLLLLAGICMPESYVWLEKHKKSQSSLPEADVSINASINASPSSDIDDNTNNNNYPSSSSPSSSSSSSPSSSHDDDDDSNNSTNAPTTSFGQKMSNFCHDLSIARKGILLSILLSAGQQLTGMNAILNYAPTILESAGLDSTDEKLIGTIFVGVWNALSAIAAAFLV